MSLGFLRSEAADGVTARSPVADDVLAAGATVVVRDGWEVAASFGDDAGERAACAELVGWADASALGKLELQGDLGGLDALPRRPGTASRSRSAWWCRIAPRRGLVLCDASVTGELHGELEDHGGLGVLDLTAASGALRVAGPMARELFARFCAIDLRPRSLPVGGVRPGSVARTPGLILREGEDRYLWVFGAAYGAYAWTVIADAGARLGGRPVGIDALPALDAWRAGAAAGA